ncbi:hypothetical protein OBV_00210 [Oscillibacter valericigenes Sjm18-20]|nr:hypothetical protein OBV_00210 [Oscillibacter valericigenes Sjm18-20]
MGIDLPKRPHCHFQNELRRCCFWFFCGKGCALNIAHLKQASSVFSKDFFLVSFLFLCGTMLFFNYLIYFIGELYETVIASKRVNAESGGTDSAQYMRTPFKRAMFSIGDRLMLACFLFVY